MEHDQCADGGYNDAQAEGDPDCCKLPLVRAWTLTEVLACTRMGSGCFLLVVACHSQLRFVQGTACRRALASGTRWQHGMTTAQAMCAHTATACCPSSVVHGCRLPAPVAICSIVAQMREQQQQQWRPAGGSASAGMEAAAGGAALMGVDLSPPRFRVTTPAAAAAGGPCGLQALLDVAVCQHNLHLRRQQWSQQQADLCTLQQQQQQQPGQAAAELGRLGGCLR